MATDVHGHSPLAGSDHRCDGSNLVSHGDGVSNALVFEGIDARRGTIPQGADVFPLSGGMYPENERIGLGGGGGGPVDH